MDEGALSEDPAVAVLQGLGYTYVPPERLEAERETFEDAIRAVRLRRHRAPQPAPHARQRRRAVRSITHATGTSLGEVNQALHVAITHRVMVQQYMRAGPGRFEPKLRSGLFVHPF